MRRILLFVLVAPLVGCADGEEPVPEAQAVYEVALRGEGAGEATIRLAPERGEVCYEIATEGVEAPTGAHIHHESGDVVLDLTGSGPGPWEDCSAADAALVARLAQRPERFYVSVHSETAPAGAVRGDLA